MNRTSDVNELVGKSISRRHAGESRCLWARSGNLCSGPCQQTASCGPPWRKRRCLVEQPPPPCDTAAGGNWSPPSACVLAKRSHPETREQTAQTPRASRCRWRGRWPGLLWVCISFPFWSQQQQRQTRLRRRRLPSSLVRMCALL